jgi:archaellum component FlaC
MIEDVDLSAIQDEAVRKQIQQLLNLLEKLWTQLRALQEENQLLRDEINQFKGQQSGRVRQEQAFVGK